MERQPRTLPDRRKAFKKMGKWLIAGAGSLTIGYFAVGREGPIDEWVDLGPLSSLPAGEIQGRRIQAVARGTWFNQRVEKTVWLSRHADNTVTVLSGVCPHKTYNIVRSPGGPGTFVCPGHKSAFDAMGNVLAGPSPRPMDSLEYKLENGNVMVRYQKFRSNIPGKEVFT